MQNQSLLSNYHPSEDISFATVPTYINSEYAEFIEPANLASFQNSNASNNFEPTASWSDSSSNHGDELYPGFSTIPGVRGLVKGARAAIQTEHRLTVTESLYLYRKAIGWSALLSLALVMEGFDLMLITSFFAFPSFNRDFGSATPHGFQIGTAWQSALTNGALTGEIIGLFMNGFLTDRFGNKITMLASLICLTGFIFIAFFAKNLPMLLVSQVLCGIPWGIFQTLSTTYATECMPVALRAYLTSSINLCWLIGQLIGAGTLRSLTHHDSQWSYRLPFGLQWMWVLPILIGVLFAPESPWWLIKHERPADAKRSVLRLTSPSNTAIVHSLKADEIVALMQHTNEVEKHHCIGTCYRDCLKGTDLRRTEIACMTWITQAICGGMTGYAAYFYVQAGLSTDRAFDLSLGMYGAGILGVFLSWILMRDIGRRTLYLWGCGLIALIFLVIGCVGASKSTSPTISWVLGSLIVLTNFVYDTTVGPICYSLVAEIPSARLRVKTVVLARVSYNVVGICMNVLMSHLLNPTAWNWKGRTCLLWAAAAALAWVWCWFRLPEPKGLTFMELDILFQKKASARSFKRVQMNLSDMGYFDRKGRSR